MSTENRTIANDDVAIVIEENGA